MNPPADHGPPNLDAEMLYESLRAQLQELRGSHTQFVGITRGGAWLAQRLQAQWGLAHIGIVSTAMHRDDFAQRGLSHAEQTHIGFEVQGSDIVLIDDVLYTGRTIRAAVNELFDYGRPARVRLAVLVDRGGRQLPICADIAAARIELPASESLTLARAQDGRLCFSLKTRQNSQVAI